MTSKWQTHTADPITSNGTYFIKIPSTKLKIRK